MIEYVEAPDASVRSIESDVAGRRVAAHAAPYGGGVGGPPFRFDPLERRLVARRAAGRFPVVPSYPAARARVFSRCPPGPVLIGPGSAVEEIRGAGAAAAEGAIRAGRGVYLLDPDPAAIPREHRRAFTAVFTWTPGEDDGDELADRLAPALAARIPAGVLLPIVPGWTDDAGFLERWWKRVAAAEAGFAAAVPATGGGEERRLLVEARLQVDPTSADSFFERVHHSDWTSALRDGLRRFRAEAAHRGLPAIPPRPIGAGEPAGNSWAAARLEERAVTQENDEHRASLLHAAARWIDESGRDLAPVVREGNFGKVFPFGALAAEAEAAFREERSP